MKQTQFRIKGKEREVEQRVEGKRVDRGKGVHRGKIITEQRGKGVNRGKVIKE